MNENNILVNLGIGLSTLVLGVDLGSGYGNSNLIESSSIYRQLSINRKIEQTLPSQIKKEYFSWKEENGDAPIGYCNSILEGQNNDEILYLGKTCLELVCDGMGYNSNRCEVK